MVENRQEEDGEIPFTEWIDDTHKKFTIIGIFGGLSVYLTQIPTEVTLPIQAGIAGSLLIFSLVATLIILEGVERALDMVNNPNPEMFFYIFTVVGLVGILLAVLSVMDRYSQGAAPLIDAGVTVGISLYYIAYLFVSNPFSQIEQENVLHRAMSYSPHIAVGWILVTEIANNHIGEQYLASFTWDPYMRGTLVLILSHFIFTVIIFSAFAAVEFVFNRFPPALRELRSYAITNYENKL